MSKQNKTCHNCGHRNGNMTYGKCMLSGYYCKTERKYATKCGIDFERWIPRPKRIGLIKQITIFFKGES